MRSFDEESDRILIWMRHTFRKKVWFRNMAMMAMSG
jgi:hypothetical protein